MPAPQTQTTDPSIADLIRQEATKAGIPPELALAVGEQESSFNPTAVGPVLAGGERAVGTFQLLPSTAKRLGVDPAHPVQNIQGGVRYLRELMDTHQGDLTKVLREYGGVKANQTYVPGVVARMPRFAETAPGQPPPAPALHIAPPADPADFTRPLSVMEYVAPTILGMGEQFDPRTKEGRRNVGGAIGAATGGFLSAPTAAVSGPAGPATGAVMGAMAGGSFVSGGEALIRHITGAPELGGDVGTPPPTLGGSAQAAAAGGTEQGLYEMGGHLLWWPVQAVGRQLIASRVGRYASKALTATGDALSATKAATLSQLQAALESSQTLLRQTRGRVSEANARMSTLTRGMVSSEAGRARQGVTGAVELGRGRVEGAETRAAQGVSQAQADAAAAEAGARAPYDQLVGQPPPSASAAGRQTNLVIQEGGPARARNLAGQAVESAAESGPDVDITALKAEAQRILEHEIQPPAEAFPRTSPAEVNAEQVAGAAGIAPERYAELQGQAAAGDPVKAEQLRLIQEAVASAQGEGGKEVLRHPALGVINRILNAEPVVKFSDAHKFKRELDEAIGTAWDRSVKSRVTNITKKLRGDLRQALTVHEPYNRATTAYQRIAPLYTQGAAPKLRRLAIEEPEAIIRLLNPAQPTRARMLVDLLTHQAEAGGGAAEGQRALEAVQAAWVYQKLIQGGIEKLGERLDKLPPAFRDAFLSDPKATAILDNLKLIHTAYQTAVLTGERGVAAAKTTGKEGVEAVSKLAAQHTQATREAGQQTVQGVRDVGEGMRGQQRQAGAQAVEQAAGGVPPARRALRQGKEAARTAEEAHGQQERALAESSIGRAMHPGAIERTSADVLRAMLQGPRSTWGGISLIRLMRGPTANDLLRWVTFSPVGTRLFVKAITSPLPALALGDLVRLSGILSDVTDLAAGQLPAPPVQEEVGAPPPPVRPRVAQR